VHEENRTRTSCGHALAVRACMQASVGWPAATLCGAAQLRPTLGLQPGGAVAWQGRHDGGGSFTEETWEAAQQRSDPVKKGAAWWSLAALGRLWKARRLTVVHGEEVAAGAPAAARKLERESGVGFL
jgi:putative intracellular protease/amidase